MPNRKMNGPDFLISGLADRHPGLTQALADCYAEAARVCLARHHTPPTVFSTHLKDEATENSLPWDMPDDRTKGAWANETDATRDGAYAISLAVVEVRERLVAIRRAETLTGADYYIAGLEADPADLENSFRLEVSGTDGGDLTVVRQRLLQKQAQTRVGLSNLPAIVAVVGFKVCVVMIAYVEEQ